MAMQPKGATLFREVAPMWFASNSAGMAVTAPANGAVIGQVPALGTAANTGAIVAAKKAKKPTLAAKQTAGVTHGPLIDAGFFAKIDDHVTKTPEYAIVGHEYRLISTAKAPFGGIRSSGLGREGSKYYVGETVDITFGCPGGIASALSQG